MMSNMNLYYYTNWHMHLESSNVDPNIEKNASDELLKICIYLTVLVCICGTIKGTYYVPFKTSYNMSMVFTLHVNEILSYIKQSHQQFFTLSLPFRMSCCRPRPPIFYTRLQICHTFQFYELYGIVIYGQNFIDEGWSLNETKANFT